MSDKQRKAMFAQMSKTKKAQLRRANRIKVRRINAIFGVNQPAQPTPIKVKGSKKPSDGKRSVVKCPNVQCPSSDCTFLELGPKNSTSYKAAIPVVGFDYTSYQYVAYYKCNNCNVIFYTKPLSAP
jgi:hypothetical protein